MKVTSTMIAKELRMIGLFMQRFMKPTRQTFIRMDRMSRRLQGANIKGFTCREVYVPGRDSSHRIRVRVYRPKHSKPEIPGVLYMHGGGYAMNTPETEHPTIKNLLKNRDCVIVAPDYRHSLDAPFPAALHDCYDTLQWMIGHHESLGFRSDQLFTIGGSAGGGLTAAVTLMARDLGEIKIAFQAPLYPMLDHRMMTASMIDNDAPVWSEAHNRLAWKLYLDGLEQDEITAYASPALNEDFTNLPPAVTFVGDLDPFLDETLAYFDKLKEAGIKAKCRVFKGAFHGFEIVNPSAPVSKQAIAFFLDNFAYAVDHYFASQPEMT